MMLNEFMIASSMEIIWALKVLKWKTKCSNKHIEMQIELEITKQLVISSNPWIIS